MQIALRAALIVGGWVAFGIATSYSLLRFASAGPGTIFMFQTLGVLIALLSPILHIALRHYAGAGRTTPMVFLISLAAPFGATFLLAALGLFSFF